MTQTIARPAPEKTGEKTGERRAELLSAIVDALLAHGVADLSLRPLAEKVGTSARLLIYHFGSKENLLSLALAQVRERVMAAIATLSQDNPAADLGMALARFWHWATQPGNDAAFRLLFELDGLSMFERITLPPAARQQSAMLWIERVESLLHRFRPDTPDLRAEATFIAATMAGLLQDRLSTGDAQRTDAAFACLLKRIA